jgi:hypothetical protein
LWERDRTYLFTQGGMMEDRPMITHPKPETTLDYSQGKITIRWSRPNDPPIKSWWLLVGTRDGLWDIRNRENDDDKGKHEEEETIPIAKLPKSGKLYAEVFGAVDGKDKNGKTTGMDEEIHSDPVWWNCP